MLLDRIPARWLAASAVLALVVLPSAAQKLGGGTKKTAPPPKGEAAAAPAREKPAAEGKGRERLQAALRGVDSPAAENERGDSDPAFDPFTWLKRGAAEPSGAAASALRLVDHPRRDELARWLVDSLRGREIDVALLGGKKYMINDCLGLKASAGQFRLKLANPSVFFENTGLVLRFEIEKVSISAIKVRIRPNPNILEVCSFSDKFEVGGDMTDVRLTLRCDPLYDLERCRVGLWSDLNPEVRIGNLNLKPLQNDLDRMAKNMIEDSLTLSLQMGVDGSMSMMGDLLLSTIDQFLEADCPTRPGDTARAVDGLGRGLGDLVRGGSGSGSGSGASSGGERAPGGSGQPGAGTGGSGAPASSGGSSDTTWSAQEVAPILARIEALEARIAQLEAGGPPPEDLAGVLEQALGSLAELGPLGPGGAASDPAVGALLARLVATVVAQDPAGRRAALLDEVVKLARGTLGSAAGSTAPTLPGSSGSAGPGARTGADGALWSVVPNPELKGRMGRVVVRFPDAELAKDTLVALHRDGKKVADRYGEAAWELMPGSHDVVVTNVQVAGCEVRSGCDTLVRVGLLQVEVGDDTLVALYRPGGREKLDDNYGSFAVGLPAGSYELEVNGQRASFEVRAGEVTRF